MTIPPSVLATGSRQQSDGQPHQSPKVPDLTPDGRERLAKRQESDPPHRFSVYSTGHARLRHPLQDRARYTKYRQRLISQLGNHAHLLDFETTDR